MCTKKELVEWLEANVPDSVEVLVVINTRPETTVWQSLNLTDTNSIEVVCQVSGPVLFIGS